MSRNVKGSVFVDYVRMIRGRKDVDWRKYLRIEDFPYLSQIIEPGAWYPMETFERYGLGILSEIAGGDVRAAFTWGRFAMDDLFRLHKNLIAEGNPIESLMRFQVLRAGFFDFDAIEIKCLLENSATVAINYQMGPVAEEASSYQTAGFLERLVELSGGKEPSFHFSQKAWQGSPNTLVQLDWS